MLQDWQKRVAESVRRGGELAAGVFRSGEERFELYRDGYWLRVSESLREDFPLTARLLGAARFEARMRDFLPVERGYELELGETSRTFAAWLGNGAAPALTRSLALDLLALETRRAPEIAAGARLALHPSVRFFAEGERVYAFWRDEEGQVLRERIGLRMLRVLECFRAPASDAEIAGRLKPLAEDLEYIRDTLEECSDAGLLARVR